MAQVPTVEQARQLIRDVDDIPSGTLSWRQAAELIRLGNLR